MIVGSRAPLPPPASRAERRRVPWRLPHPVRRINVAATTRRTRAIASPRRTALAVTLAAAMAVPASGARAQVVPPDSAATTSVPTAAAAAPPSAGATPDAAPLPVFLTVGMGYGQRFDGCAQCVSPQDVESFTAHVSVGKYLVPGLGIGVDASVWRRGHPGLAIGADSLSAGTPTRLVNQLGNASLTLSWQTWHVFLRAGLGVALGQQDLQDAEGTISTARGIGVGYSFGAGATVPLASVVSLALFANWNTGSYDLSTPTEIVARGVSHELIEVGFGLTLR